MKLQFVYNVVRVMIWTKKGGRYETKIQSMTNKEGAEKYVNYINNDGTDRYAEIMKSEKVFRVEGIGNIKVPEFLNHKALDTHSCEHGITQYKFSFDNRYGASVVNFSAAYTNNSDDWELAVLKDGELCYNTPITHDVVNYLEVDEVLTLLDKIERL